MIIRNCNPNNLQQRPILPHPRPQHRQRGGRAQWRFRAQPGLAATDRVSYHHRIRGPKTKPVAHGPRMAAARHWKDGTLSPMLCSALRPWPCCGLDFLVTFCVKTKSKGNSAGAGSLLKTATTPLAQRVGTDPLAAAFFTQQNTQSQANRPKAYLTVLFFDACPEGLRGTV